MISAARSKMLGFTLRRNDKNIVYLAFYEGIKHKISFLRSYARVCGVFSLGVLGVMLTPREVLLCL